MLLYYFSKFLVLGFLREERKKAKRLWKETVGKPENSLDYVFLNFCKMKTGINYN